MILKNKYKDRFYQCGEFYCDLTSYLDELAKILEHVGEDIYTKYAHRHYILVLQSDLEDRILPIRIPGGTVGGIWIDENSKIIDIKVDTNYVVKTYPKDVEELVREKFIGEQIEF